MHQDRFARLQFSVIEQHVFHSRARDTNEGRVLHFNAGGDFHHQPGVVVGEVLSPAVDVENRADAENVFVEIVAIAQT